MRGPVVVTGATGFVGRHLVPALAERGYEVRAVVRRRPHLDVMSGIDSYCIDDIVDADWHEVLEGADALVHLAAIAHRRDARERARVWAVNATAAGRLAAAARTAGVRRMVLLSSVGVLGSSTGSASFNGDSVPKPHDFYSWTKLESERAAALVAEDGSLELSIVRSPLVFGPNAPGNFGRLLRLLNSPYPLPLGAIHNRRSLVSVWNLCDFLMACIASPGAVGAPLLVAEDEVIGTSELLRTCGEILNRRARLISVPVPMLRFAGVLLGRRLDVERLCQSLIVDTRLSKERLGWRPPLSLREALIRTLRPELSRPGELVAASHVP